jgi:hypothetical protein
VIADPTPSDNPMHRRAMARSAENSFAGTSGGTTAGGTNWYRTF